MLTAGIGIMAAVVFGAADFLGGLAARRSHAVLVTATVSATGLAALLVCLPFVPGRWSGEALLWGALSGVAGALAIALLYACLAIGPMSILSPLTAVVSALVPVAVGLGRGEQLGQFGYLALGLALAAVVLVGFVPEAGAVRPSLKGVLMAIASGALIGTFLVLLDLAPADSGLVPLLANRSVNAALMGLAILVLLWRRPAGSPLGLAGLKLAAFGGVLDATANALMLFGVRIGDLAVIGMLAALYPAGTVLLAATVLRERIAPVQWAGLGLAVVATVLLAV